MHAMAERTDFTDLLKARRAALGYSLREMEARCVDPKTGAQAKFGWLSKVENGKSVDAPKPEILVALSIGFELPVKVLKRAASAQFLDYDPTEDAPGIWSRDHTTRVLAARVEEMDDEGRRELADIAEIYARRRTQRDGNSEE